MKQIIAIAILLSSSARLANAHTAAISIVDLWSRPATGTAVVYATVRNAGNAADRLIGATSPLATQVELHESSASKGPRIAMKMNGMTMPMDGSVMSMKSITAIPIPARGTATLSPGGYHLMLDLKSDLHAGQQVPLRLHFAHAGWIAAVAHVRPM